MYDVLRLKEQMFIPGAYGAAAANVVLGSRVLLVVDHVNFDQGVHCVAIWTLKLPGLLNEHLIFSVYHYLTWIR